MSKLTKALRACADDQSLCGVDAGRTRACHADYLLDDAADRIEKLESALVEVGECHGMTILGPTSEELSSFAGHGDIYRSCHAVGASKAFDQCAEIARDALK